MITLDDINDHLLESVLLEYGQRDFEADVDSHRAKKRSATIGGGVIGAGLGAAAGYGAHRMGLTSNLTTSMGAGAGIGGVGGALFGRRRENKKFANYRQTLPRKFRGGE